MLYILQVSVLRTDDDDDDDDAAWSSVEPRTRVTMEALSLRHVFAILLPKCVCLYYDGVLGPR